MTYVEGIAVDLARVVGAQRGSLAFQGIVGALKDVVERCAVAAITCETGGCEDEQCIIEHRAAARIRALAAPSAGPEVPQPTEAPQERYSALYFQASENMDRHYRRAREDRPCSCVGAGGSREMCEEGRAIYATVVNPTLLAGAPCRDRGRR